VFILISFAACISLFLRKKWARIVSDIASALTIIVLVVWCVDALSLTAEFGSPGFFVVYLLPVVIALILIAPSVFSIIFLMRPRVKEYFKQQLQIEPAVPVSSK
jgi:hypothetical protein